MNSNIYNIVYSSAVSDMTNVNSSFDRGVIRVAYHGENRNRSTISKEAFERSMHTIYNVPVVCNYNRDEDEIGSHDKEIVGTGSDMHMVNITEPVGVVPVGANYGWETIEEADGSIHEYLWIEAIIWKRQEAYKHIKANKITAESMEITVKDGRTVDGILSIDSFEFTAFCLLESAEPCFESACLEMFSLNSFGEQYRAMIADFKEQFNDVNASNEDDIDMQENLSKGGEVHLEIKDEIEIMDADAEVIEDPEFVQKKNIDDEDDDNESNIDTENDVEDDNVVSQDSEPDATVSGAEENEQENSGESYELAAKQMADEIARKLESDTIEDPIYGAFPKYLYVDHDSDNVYAYGSNDWLLYGFGYSMNGDYVDIDFESKCRVKIKYETFDDCESVGYGIESAMKKLCNAVSDVAVAASTSEIGELQCKIDELQSYINELEQYKCKKEKETYDRLAEDIFARFADLDNVSEFQTLVENHDGMEIEALESKCFELRGRFGSNMQFSNQNAHTPSHRLPVTHIGKNEDEPYGGLFKKFPPKKN